MQMNLNATCSRVNRLFIASAPESVNNLCMNEILKRVEHMLSERGWTWAEFARALNTSDQRVYNWRKRGIPKSEADRIANILECSIDWLLTGKESKPFDVFREVRRQIAAEHRRPGEEDVPDEVIYERAKEEDSWLVDEIQERMLIQSGAYEAAAERDGKLKSKPREVGSSSPKKDELEFFGHMDAWDSKTPLDEDEVELPLFREVELAAGAGQTQVVENNGAKLRFAKSTLSRAGVVEENAACAFVRGNSMEPVMPDGTCVGVNTGDTSVRDGEIYAIDHDGMLRVKYLHRRPGGGIKIVSQNAAEHATEEYSAQEVIDNNLRIIGRVFWWSVLR